MKTPKTRNKRPVHSSFSQSFFNKKGGGDFFVKSPIVENPFFSTPTIQTKLSIGESGDKYEREADSVAHRVMRLTRNQSGNPNGEVTQSKKPKPIIQKRKNEDEETLQTKTLMMKSGGGKSMASPALASQLNRSKRGGSSLPKSTLHLMNNAFGSDFSNVKIHTRSNAALMNQGLNARAFTHGSDIFFDKGEYDTESFAGKHLLAHELVHVVQQGKGKKGIQKQATPPTSPPMPQPQPPRQDVVYIMGRDRRRSGNRFFTAATRFFRSRFPSATFVTDLRTLSGLLEHLTTTFTTPMGNIFIISHANEDGTLSFQLDANDSSSGLTAVELRNALNSTSGSTSLPTVGNQVDSQTRIKIKGCDLGRNQRIVELFDRVFNGQGTVTAPTHEQVYSFREREIQQGRRAAMTEHIQQFETTLSPIPTRPARVDRTLRGDERREARRGFRAATVARTQAVRARRAAIAAERRRFTPTAQRMGEVAGTHESLSGPMFQRLGTNLFTAAELRPQIDTLYDHLSETQRARLARRLIARDRRNHRVAHRQGTFGQQGQRQYHYENRFPYAAPQDLAQSIRVFRVNFRRAGFTPTSINITSQTTDGITIFSYSFEGHKTRRPSESMSFSGYTSAPVESNQILIDRVKSSINNPQKFNWAIRNVQQANGRLVKTVIRERVVCYLHHGSLDASRGDRFTAPESDARFYARSTFTPPVTPP